MSFDYTIRVDGSAGLKTIEAHEQGLARVEDDAKRTGVELSKAFSSPALRDAAGRFSAIGAAAERMRSQIASASSGGFDRGVSLGNVQAQLRAFEVHQRMLASATSPLEASFAGVAKAMQQEAAMLERIRGPAERVAAEQRTLNSLLAQGQISLTEYNQQLARLGQLRNQGQGRDPGLGQGPSQPSALSMLKGGLTSSLGLVGIGVGAGAVIQMVGAFQALENRLRTVVAAGQPIGAVFQQVKQTAINTRSDLNSTAEAFVRLRTATKDLGLTNDAVLLITERMNKAIKVSGADAGSAAAASLQLTQAFASGRLQGDEFRSIMENTPYVLEIVAKSLRTTVGSLREMASQGKLTSDVLITAFTTAGKQIDEDFAKTTPTVNEQIALFRDQLMDVLGNAAQATGIFKSLGDALGLVGDALGMVSDLMSVIGGKDSLTPIGLLRDGLHAVGDELRSMARESNDFHESTADMAGFRGPGEFNTRNKAEAYLQLLAIEKQVLAEEERIDRVMSTKQMAISVGIQFPDSIDTDLAKSMARVRAVFSAAGVSIGDQLGEATSKAAQLDAELRKLTEQASLAKIAEDAKKLYNNANDINPILEEQRKNWAAINDQLAEAEAAFERRSRDRHIGQRPINDLLPIDADYIDAQRRLEDAQLRVDEGAGRYGQTVIRLRQSTMDYERQLDDVTGAYRAGKITIKEYTDEMGRLTSGMDTQKRASVELELAQIKLNQVVADARAAGAGAGPWTTNIAATRQYAEALREVEDKTLVADQGLGQFGATIVRVKQATRDHERGLADARGAYQLFIDTQGAAGISAREYAQELKRLGSEEGAASQLLRELVGDSMKRYSDALTGLNALLRLGRIEAALYNQELLNLKNPLAGLEQARGPVGIRKMGGQELSVGVEKTSPTDNAVRSLKSLGVETDTSTVINDKYAASLDRQRSVMESIDGPRTKFREDMTTLNELLAQGAITLTEWTRIVLQMRRSAIEPATQATAEWNKEIERLRDQRDLGKGLEDGLNRIYNQMQDVAGLASSTLFDAFKGLEDTLVNAATTGELSFESLFSSVEQGLARLAIRILEMAALQAIFGGGLAGAMGGGSGGGGGLAGFLFGGAHATGGSYVVPGSGGPDSQNVMFRLTPGERVDFTPPGRQPRGGGSTHVHIHEDRRALLPALETNDGERAVVNIVRKNRGAVGGLLKQ